MSADNDVVITPGGQRHRSQVHLIGEGNPYVHGRHGTIAPKILQRPGPPGQANWISCADWTNTTGSPLKSFRANWRVPAAPGTVASQLLYLFNGLEPYDGSTIVQPVLQWGESGPDEDGLQRTGSFWTVACWMVPGPDGHTYHTPHVRVSEGILLVGRVDLLEQSAGGFEYTCEFAGIAGTAFTTPALQELSWCALTLEAYELESAVSPPYDLNLASEYPASRTDFQDIDVSTAAGSGNVRWTVKNLVTGFWEHTVVVANSGVNGEFEINY